MYENHILVKLENIHSQLSEVIDSNNIDKQDLSFAREQLEEVREVFITDLSYAREQLDEAKEMVEEVRNLLITTEEG